jgi:D-cysteine desulfhydrase family pyridoxal phosphate-dependent enzyme
MMSEYNIEDIKEKVAKFPRVSLIHLPTPFRKLDNLTAYLGGPAIYIKRDDLTGLAFGGNKSRKLEYIISDMLAKQADTVVTWASLQSNWCMQTAAAARKFGIRPVLVLFKTYDLDPGYDGNLLLDYILDADIRMIEAQKGKVVKAEQALEILNGIAGELRKKGRRPYVVPVGGSAVNGDLDRPLGAVSYVGAYAEMLEQARGKRIEVDYVVHSTGSGGTQAGLLAGSGALTDSCRVVGISVSDEKESFSRLVRQIAEATVSALDLDISFSDEDVIVFDDYIREGYGAVSREVAEVIRLVFIKEGIVLDPVYTAKAMIGLIDLVSKGYFQKKDNVVFFHTGGTPALFPYRDKLVDYLRSSR